ncbi:UDP-N-acetylmuramate dehydrogenase [Leptolyngbya sp. GGD]|uniref:UDP-N-acetylmuramate dehydrogenase n=1 Tax=Leptolyngbya sp. GGD TaxID=2997907 RepID=UPI00227A523B|nr:UDP-N-acetylmuramate dehydrogenase [Leptolyngbya sp. GGD]MCY6493020.1 UDP-N-acetylmuramate dehydrogenase [Leptolyngbya sp. GGD]
MTLSIDSRTVHSPVISDFSRKSSSVATPYSSSEATAKPARKILTLPLPGTDAVLKANVPLASLTSFRVGGPAEWYAAPRTTEELQASLEWAHAQDIPVTMLGAGSNLLVSDAGLPGLVISTRHLRLTEFDDATGQVTVGAGEPLPRLAWKLADRGWQGFEWAVGIPGTVGGAVVMNAGAHNSSISEILVKTTILRPDGTLQVLKPAELQYEYRTSALQGSSRYVTYATFQLQPGADPTAVNAVTANHKQQRQNTQPYHLPSCGSVFRNPDAYKAGWLIEQVGLKGHQIGGAQVAQRHANFILNCGGATASDIFELIHHVQQRVHQEWSLLLEPEVKMLGEF